MAPTVLALQSPHVDLQLHGWRTTSGMVLREPATAAVEYTPALARWARSPMRLVGGTMQLVHWINLDVSCRQFLMR